jgi:hypothetical protein
LCETFSDMVQTHEKLKQESKTNRQMINTGSGNIFQSKWFSSSYVQSAKEEMLKCFLLFFFFKNSSVA